MGIICGIYCIKNKSTGKVYIGKSVDVSKRLYSHSNALNNRTHANKDLLKDWEQVGYKGFEVSLLEECKENELSNREQYYIDKFDSVKQGYNQVRAIYDRELYTTKNFTIENEIYGKLQELCEQENINRSDLISEMVGFCYKNYTFNSRNKKINSWIDLIEATKDFAVEGV